MSKVNLIPQIVESLQATQSQEKKLEIVKKYEKETLFKRIVLFSYNPWIDFKLQHFVPKHMGKQFGMGMSRFMHMFEELIEGQLDPKDEEFGFNMAFLHVNLEEAPILLGIINQTLDLGLEIETINEVWPASISSYPIRTAKVLSYKKETVGAGAFMAYTIEYKGTVSNSRGYSAKTDEVLLYAPEIKNFIKITQVQDGFSYTEELIEYSK